jgi:hypothetical protein
VSFSPEIIEKAYVLHKTKSISYYEALDMVLNDYPVTIPPDCQIKVPKQKPDYMEIAEFRRMPYEDLQKIAALTYKRSKRIPPIALRAQRVLVERSGGYEPLREETAFDDYDYCR